MAVPNTGGKLIANVTGNITDFEALEIGDYVIGAYYLGATSNVVGTFGDRFFRTGEESPYAGRPTNVTAKGNAFYWIKVSNGLLVADRVVQNTISWDKLNEAEFIEGKPFTLSGMAGIIRSLGGGNTYATVDGQPSTTNTGSGGWPTNNEWDTYILNKDYGTGAGRDDIWHFNATSFVQETRKDDTSRLYRGLSMANNLSFIRSDYANTTYGFRPAFEYQEVTP